MGFPVRVTHFTVTDEAQSARKQPESGTSREGFVIEQLPAAVEPDQVYFTPPHLKLGGIRVTLNIG